MMRVNRRTAVGVGIGLVVALTAATVAVLLLHGGSADAARAWDSCDDLGVMACPRQVARASVPVAGTTMRLTYASDRVPGRKAGAAPPVAQVGLAGWTLDVVDILDPASGTLVTGSGALRRVSPVAVSLGAGRHAVASVDGRRVRVFDGSGRPVSVYDGMTGAVVSTFAWNAHGLASVTDGAGNTLTVRRDSTGTPVRLDTSRGVHTRLGVRDGYLAAVGYPDGGLARLSHRPDGLLKAWSDAAGVAVRFEYDRDGRMTSRTDGTGATTRYERRTSGATMTVLTTGPTGTTTKDTVEGVSGGVVRTRVDGQGSVTRLKALGTRRVIEMPFGRTATIELAPDPRWGMDAPVTASVSANGVAPLREKRTGGDRTRPDAGQAVRTVVTVEGSEWTLSYDPARRVSTTTAPGGQKSEVTFDPKGRIATHVGAAQPSTAYEYDDAGRLAVMRVGTGGDQRTWKYDYGNGRLTATDPLGGPQVRTYAANGTLATVAGPGDRGLTLSTDAAGALTSYAGPDGNAYRLVHRANGQLAAVTAPAGESGAGFTTYEYDAASRITGVAWPDAKQTITREASGRVRVIDSGAGAWQLEYGPDGQLTRTSGPGASTGFRYADGTLVAQRIQGPFDVTVTRTTDPLGRTRTIAVGADPAVAYAYDRAGLISKAGDLTAERDPITGLLWRERVGSLTREWSYNQFREPVEQSITTSNGTVVAKLVWKRDKLGRVISETVVAGTRTTTVLHTYDAAGRLARTTRDGRTTSYGYDAAGNLVAVAAPDGPVVRATYDGRNALVERAGVRYRYDGAGRLASTTSASGTTRYRYDRAGALLSVQPAQGPQIEYVNDALGRRVARKVGGTVTGGFVYLDQVRPAAEVDATGAVVTRYTYGDSPTPLYSTSGSTNYLQVTDAAGSPVLAVNAADGTIANEVTRDPWGRITSQTRPGFQAVGFGGGITDPDTGLVRFGARDYVPATGGWTAPDPLGVYGGNPNLYSYVSGDPVNRRDPDGRCEFVSVGISGGAAYKGYGFRGGIGLATAGTQLGVYAEGGAEVGAEGHLTVDFKCQQRFEPGNRQATLSDFDGFDISTDVGFGAAGVGMELDPKTAGVTVKVGPASGVGVGTGNTEFWCWAGCPEVKVPSQEEMIKEAERQAGCEGADAGLGLCNPAPNDPAIGSRDDLNNPSNMCEASGGATCNETDPDDPTLPGAGGPGSTGDPHLRTADGTYYDMHAAGEFVALTADAGDLAIQTRQQPVPGNHPLAVNTAVAIKAHGDRIVASPSGTDRIAVTVNGQPRHGTGSGTLPKGAVLQIGSKSVAVRLADGTAIGIARNPLGLDVTLQLAEARKGRVHGLLGPFTGQAGKVVARDGTAFDTAQLDNYDTLYSRFVETWRVTDAESLFDYGPGQSTATFTDRTFPRRATAPVSDGARAAAEQLCRHLGIPAEALAACVIDVAATGQAGFAASTVTSTGTRPGAAPSRATPSGPPPVSGSRVLDGTTVRGRVEAGGAAVRYELDLAGADSFYVADWTGPAGGCDQAFSVNVVGVSNGNFPCSGGIVHFRVPDAGRKYQLEIAPAAASGGSYMFTLVTVKVRTVTIGLGSSHQGRIDVRGRVDRYTFAAQGAGAIRLSGLPQACSAGLVVEVFDDSQRVVMGNRGLCGAVDRIVLPDPNGRYAIHVRSESLATAEYSFTVAAG